MFQSEYSVRVKKDLHSIILYAELHLGILLHNYKYTNIEKGSTIVDMNKLTKKYQYN